MVDIYDAARAWMAEDPDPATRAEIQALLDAGDRPALEERFRQRLSFGTAGIRGVLGAGPGRMNRAMARLVAAGLGRVLLERVPAAAERGVAVAYDARILSHEMALDVCSVLAGLELRVHLLPAESPTPLLAFAILDLNAAAGVMVTASHNPPEYNGVKVFWDNGAQIVPPVDEEISAAIDAISSANDESGSVASVPFLALDEARQRGLLEDAGPASPRRGASVTLEDRYLAAIERQVPSSPDQLRGRKLDVVYTPLHGVGWQLARRAFERQGLTRISVVASQVEPDGRFPTVRFPNPEDHAVLDLALRQARLEDAAVVLAHDPDADRLAAACRGPGGQYRVLSGDQIGCLLGYYLLDRYRASGGRPADGFVVTTIVSSSQLGRIAGLFDVRCELTLTGLKWVWNRALELEGQGGTFIFGYEEALGYSVSAAVHDKDGISAGLLLAEIASELAARDKTLLDLLDEIDARTGVVATRQVTLPLPPEAARETVHRLIERLRRDAPALGGFPLLRLSDFENGERIDFREGRNEPIDLPSSPVVQLELEAGRTVTLRPSGTEPKLKIYLEAGEPPAERVGEARQRANAALDVLEQAVASLLDADQAG